MLRLEMIYVGCFVGSRVVCSEICERWEKRDDWMRGGLCAFGCEGARLVVWLARGECWVCEGGVSGRVVRWGGGVGARAVFCVVPV